MPSLSLSEARSILVVRLDALGDVVLTGPFLRELRRNAPKAKITLVVQPPALNLVELCPYVDRILTFRGNADHSGLLCLAWRFFVFCVCHIWGRHWDIAINPRFDADSYGATFLLWLSRADRRVGYSQCVTPEKAGYNRRHDWLLTDPLNAGAARHEVLHNLDLIRQIGGVNLSERLELWCSDEDQRVAKKATGRFNRDDRRLCAIIPAAGEGRKIWPGENFREVARLLCRDHNCNIVVVGGPDAADFGAKLEAEIPGHVLNTAGRMTVRQSAALLKLCALAVTNDSGPMHLAAAAGSQIIVVICHPLTGSTGHASSPVRFGPWQAVHRVLQPMTATPPCATSCSQTFSHCIRRVSPEQVLEVVKELLPLETEQLETEQLEFRVRR